MFSRDSFTPTYSGPVLASGETLGRAKSEAGAGRSFVGNERAYQPKTQMAGVRAGSKGSVYRAGLLGDQQAAAAGDHYAAQLARMSNDADARLEYDTRTGEEQEGLRRLLFDTDQTERTSQNAFTKDKAFESVSGRQRQGDAQMGRMARKNQVFGLLGNIFS